MRMMMLHRICSTSIVRCGHAAVLVVALVLGPGALAQSSRSATATASVRIFKPLSIQTTAQLSFGRLQYNASSGVSVSTVIVPAQAPSTRVSNGAVLLPNGGETPAVRVLSGEPGSTYRVTILNTTSNPDNLPVTTYTLWSQNSGNITSSRTGVLDAQGRDTVRIGASLSVPQKTKIDTFTAAPAIQIAYE